MFLLNLLARCDMTVVYAIVVDMPVTASGTLMTPSIGISGIRSRIGRLIVANMAAVAMTVAFGMFVALTDDSSLTIVSVIQSVGEHFSLSVPTANMVDSTGYILVYFGTLTAALTGAAKPVMLVLMLIALSRCTSSGSAVMSDRAVNVAARVGSMVPKNAKGGMRVMNPSSSLPMMNVRTTPSMKFSMRTSSSVSSVLVPDAAVVAEAVFSIIIVHGASLIMQLMVPQTMFPARLKNCPMMSMLPR